MAMPVNIQGAKGAIAHVTEQGTLAVSPRHFDVTTTVTLDTAAQVYNLVTPKVSNVIIVTGILATGNKNINASVDATLNIFEADSVDGSSTKNVVTLFVPQSGLIPLIGLHLLVEGGKYINATTSDDDVDLTLFYHYNEVRS